MIIYLSGDGEVCAQFQGYPTSGEEGCWHGNEAYQTFPSVHLLYRQSADLCHHPYTAVNLLFSFIILFFLLN